MKTRNVLCLTGVAIFLGSAGICNGAYQQRDSLQLHVKDPVSLQQQEIDQLQVLAANQTTSEKKMRYRHEYHKGEAVQAGETYRHRHQNEKKGADDKRGDRKQKGTGGKKQGGSAGGKGGKK